MGADDADDLDPLLHQATRARLMAYLHRSRQASFAQARDALGLTPGNLQGHAAKLEAAGYIEARRVLAGVFEVRDFITDAGARAFRAYVARLQALVAEAGLEEGG